MGKYTYMSIDELAEYFRLSPSTIRNWINNGRIPSSSYFKGGGVYRIALEKVEGVLMGEQEPLQEPVAPEQPQTEGGLSTIAKVQPSEPDVDIETPLEDIEAICAEFDNDEDEDI